RPIRPLKGGATMPSILEDKDAIRELLALYCFHFDGGRFDDWLELFTEDGVFDVKGVGRYAGRDQLRAFLKNLPLTDGKPGMKRWVMNGVGEGDGASASAQSYVLVARGGGRLDLGVAGRYQDRLRRVDRRWRFAERQAFLDFMNR